MFKYKLHDSERLVSMHRQTEWVLAKPLIIILLGIYIPWFFLIKYELVDSFHKWLLFWTVILVFYGAYKYLLWLLNVDIITNQRAIKVKYHSLLNKSVFDAPHGSITNISVHNKGMLASLFDFGNVNLQIIGGGPEIILEKVRHPAKVKDEIWRIKQPASKPANIIHMAAPIKAKVL